MAAYLIQIAVGIILMVIGINNLKGDISSIHSYHRNRVSEEDKAIFGKYMGTGTIICSIGVMLFAVLSYLTELLTNKIYITAGTWTMIICLIIGIGFMVYATVKFNKGVF